MVNARLLVQQFTHPVHPNSSNHLSYLLSQFVDKTGKICNRQQTKHKGKINKTTKKYALGGKERGASVCFVLFGFDRGCLDGASLGK